MFLYVANCWSRVFVLTPDILDSSVDTYCKFDCFFSLSLPLFLVELSCVCCNTVLSFESASTSTLVSGSKPDIFALVKNGASPNGFGCRWASGVSSGVTISTCCESSCLISSAVCRSNSLLFSCAFSSSDPRSLTKETFSVSKWPVSWLVVFGREPRARLRASSGSLGALLSCPCG